MSHRRSLVLIGCLLLACDDGVLRAFEPRTTWHGGTTDPTPIAQAGTAGVGGTSGGTTNATTAGTANAATGGTTNATTGGTTSATAGGIDSMGGAGATEASSPLLIDDFEDGDTHAEPPLGWWYPINDKTAAQGLGIEPAGADATSVYALRTHGSGFQQWGAAVGLDLKNGLTPLNALNYETLCFTARVESGANTSIQVHLLRGEQHYSTQLALSESWNHYCLAVADFLGPNGAVLVPDELTALQFFFPPQSRFALWLDDLELVP